MPSLRHYLDIVSEAQTDFRVVVMAGRQTAAYIDDHDPDLWENRRIRYLIHNEAVKEFHVVVFSGEKIVAMGGMQDNPNDPRHLWIKFVSVDPEYQGRGLGRMVLREIFRYAAEHEQKVAPGSFTEEGERLAHMHDEFEAEFPTAAFARDERGNYINARGQIVRAARATSA